MSMTVSTFAPQPDDTIVCSSCRTDVTGQLATTWPEHGVPCGVCGDAHPTCQHPTEEATPMTRAIIIPVNGQIVERELPTPVPLADLQAIVGGYVECVTMPDEQHCMYLNEEGKISDPPLPINARATALAAPVLGAGDFVCGDVVVLGPVDDDGNNTSCKVSLDEILQLADAPGS